MSTPSELTIQQSVFEGLFCRVLTPTGPFRDELRQVGYDLDRQRPTYPLEVWSAALRVAARHAHPGVSEPEALARLGEQFIGGFFETLTGRIVAVAMPVLGADGLMKRLARFWEAGAPGTGIDSWPEGAGDWRVVVRHPSPQPDFDTGLLRAGLQRAGVDASVELLERTATGYQARVRWSGRR